MAWLCQCVTLSINSLYITPRLYWLVPFPGEILMRTIVFHVGSHEILVQWIVGPTHYNQGQLYKRAKKIWKQFFLSFGDISTVVLVLYLSIVMIWCHDVVGWEATLWPITFLKPSFVAFLELLDAKHTTAVLISWEEDWLHLLSRALCSVVLNNEYLVIFLFRLTSFNRCIHYRYYGRWNPKVALIKFFIVLRCFYK